MSEEEIEQELPAGLSRAPGVCSSQSSLSPAVRGPTSVRGQAAGSRREAGTGGR